MVGEWTCRGCGRAAGSALLLSWVCCWGCIVGCACAAKWLWERQRAENNNNNNTAITTDWTCLLSQKPDSRHLLFILPCSGCAEHLQIVCCIIYVFITFMPGVYSIHRDIPATRENKGICIIQRCNIPILLPSFTPCHPQTNILPLHKRQSRVSIEPCPTSYQQQPTLPVTQHDHNTIRKH